MESWRPLLRVPGGKATLWNEESRGDLPQDIKGKSRSAIRPDNLRVLQSAVVSSHLSHYGSAVTSFVLVVCLCPPGGVHLPHTSQYQCWSQRLGCEAAEAQPDAKTAHPGSPGSPLGGWERHQETHNSNQRRAQPVRAPPLPSNTGGVCRTHQLHEGGGEKDTSQFACMSILIYLCAAILSHFFLFQFLFVCPFSFISFILSLNGIHLSVNILLYCVIMRIVLNFSKMP